MSAGYKMEQEREETSFLENMKNPGSEEEKENLLAKARKWVPDTGYLSKKMAAMILVSFSYGSAVSTMPNCVVRIGPILWIVCAIIIIGSLGFCTYLNNHSIRYLVDLQEDEEEMRDRIQQLLKRRLGKSFEK